MLVCGDTNNNVRDISAIIDTKQNMEVSFVRIKGGGYEKNNKNKINILYHCSDKCDVLWGKKAIALFCTIVSKSSL